MNRSGRRNTNLIGYDPLSIVTRVPAPNPQLVSRYSRNAQYNRRPRGRVSRGVLSTTRLPRPIYRTVRGQTFGPGGSHRQINSVMNPRQGRLSRTGLQRMPRGYHGIRPPPPRVYIPPSPVPPSAFEEAQALYNAVSNMPYTDIASNVAAQVQNLIEEEAARHPMLAGAASSLYGEFEHELPPEARTYINQFLHR